MKLPKASPALALCAFLVCGCGRARDVSVPVPPAGPRPGLEIRLVDRSYEVSAVSARGLNRELREMGPRQEGRAAHALTGWRLRWSYVPVREGGFCVCGSPRVELELVTTLPRWREVAHAPDDLRRDWSIFLGRLRGHEAVHQDLAVANGRELLELLDGAVAGDCAGLRREVERRARGVEASWRERHAAFDRRTRFGRAPDRLAEGEGPPASHR